MLRTLTLITLLTSSGITNVLNSRVFSCSSKFRSRDTFRCHNGTDCINIKHMCDGITDCLDASDEEFCSLPKEGSYLQPEDRLLNRSKRQVRCRRDQLQCPDGSCVSLQENCGQETCVLPKHPLHGTYKVSGAPHARPGQVFKSFVLTLSCRRGYGVLESDVSVNVNGTHEIFCVNGKWLPQTMPQCVPYCTLTPDLSVRYTCRGPKSRVFQACPRYVPHGTSVDPQCNSPVYYSHNSLLYMNCQHGWWDYVAKCEPDCGRVTPEGLGLITNGKAAKRGELPWHVGIYMKNMKPYKQICGGTLVSNNVVISAAHCFWSDVLKKLPATEFAVAVGKLFRLWKSENDVESQESDVAEIIIPERFQGTLTTLQADVAALILVTPIVYKAHVRPVCLSFTRDFDSLQLQTGKHGKVAGWGLTAANGPASELLKVVEMPYVDYNKCLRSVPQSFQQFITLDKFCAGHTDGTAVCRGDSGGGLAFATPDQHTQRYYLRGIVSAAPTDDSKECNDNTYATFTRIAEYGDFIKEALRIGPNTAGVSNSCPAYQIQCDDGSCVYHEADCDRVQECLDGTEDSCIPEPDIQTKTADITTFQNIPVLPDYGEAKRKGNDFGSLVAQCFLREPLSPANLTVVAGQQYRKVNDMRNTDLRQSKVEGVSIPKSDPVPNLAVLTLFEEFIFNSYIQPVSISFDQDSSIQHLAESGQLVGWNPEDEELTIMSLAHISTEDCAASLSERDLSGSFCTGYSGSTQNAMPLEGSGLVYRKNEDGTTHHYLRGVMAAVETCSETNNCASGLNNYIIFTKISEHEEFLKQYLKEKIETFFFKFQSAPSIINKDNTFPKIKTDIFNTNFNKDFSSILDGQRLSQIDNDELRQRIYKLFPKDLTSSKFKDDSFFKL